MPAFKGSIEKNFGRKFLDGMKYVGKNSWKVLPVAGFINGVYNNFNSNNKIIKLLKFSFHSLNMLAFGIYFTCSVNSNSFNPTKWNKNDKHYNQINSSYDSLFKDAKTFSDSLAVYQHYGLPVILPEPTLEEKETAVKINELEKSLK